MRVILILAQTTNLQLEDVDYLFEMKGITAGARGEARARIQSRHDQENARRGASLSGEHPLNNKDKVELTEKACSESSQERV